MQKKIAIITLNNKENFNALNEMMINELLEAFIFAQRDNNVRVVLLKSEGDVFCTGFDPNYLKNILKNDFNQNLIESAGLVKLFQQIYTLRKPVIALVQGNALEFGCELACVCDFIIASKNAKFGFTEIKYGFIPATALLFLIKKIGEGRARELVLQANIITATEALNIGLVNKIIDSDDIQKSAIQFAQELSVQNSCNAIGLVKELFARVNGMSTKDALEYASNLNALNRMTDDCKRGIDALTNLKSIKW